MQLGRGDTKGVASSWHDRGFTLLELIIVLVLMGLLMTVSVPALRNTFLGDPLRSAGRTLIGYIGGVREKAVSERQAYVLYIDLDRNRLWHLPEKDAGSGEAEVPEKGILEMAEDVEIRDIWSKAGGTVSRGVAEIWVSRQGYLDRTVIHLEDGDGEALSLRMLPFLPDIEVLDGYHEPE